jgi:hypothetical protein
MGALFMIARAIAAAPPGKRRAVRQRDSRPVVERFFAWCDAEAERVLDQTPIARGIGYARNQREALQRFLDDPRLPVHNNASERALRREVRPVSLCSSSSSAGNYERAIVARISTRATTASAAA